MCERTKLPLYKVACYQSAVAGYERDGRGTFGQRISSDDFDHAFSFSIFGIKKKKLKLCFFPIFVMFNEISIFYFRIKTVSLNFLIFTKRKFESISEYGFFFFFDIQNMVQYLLIIFWKVFFF